jgi:hypothetical protein
MSVKEFGENWKFKMATRGYFLMKKLPFCLLIILGKNIAKCKDMPYERRSAEI